MRPYDYCHWHSTQRLIIYRWHLLCPGTTHTLARAADKIRRATGRPECASDQWPVAGSCLVRLEASALATGHSSHRRCSHLCIVTCTRTRRASSPATDRVELFSLRRARALLTSILRARALLGHWGPVQWRPCPSSAVSAVASSGAV